MFCISSEIMSFLCSTRSSFNPKTPFPGFSYYNTVYRSGSVEEVRSATSNEAIDARMLMRSIRTTEYKNIVKEYYGALPEMNSFNMFNVCGGLLEEIPAHILHKLFIAELKKRQSNTSKLRTYTKELRQLCLSMNISTADYDTLKDKLNIPVKI